MPTMVGTITVWVEQRNRDRRTTAGRNAEDPAHRRSVEHRRLMQVHRRRVEGEVHRNVVQVEHLRSMLDRNALGQAGGAAGVHEHGEVGLLGLVRRDGLHGGEELFVGHVVGNIGIAEQIPDKNRVPDRTVAVLTVRHGVGEQAGEEPVDKDHLGA
jgi:hypothetical protein